MAEKLAPPDIPQTLDALTPEWLTASLGPDWLGAARVAKVQCEPLGEGQGFVGQLARLHLSVEGDAPRAPRSLIAKLPTTVPENRAVGEMLGAYEREIYFYRELGPQVGYRTPTLYYADMDPNPAAAWGPAIVRFMDKLPIFLIQWLMLFFQWVARNSTRRYVLLIEDLAPARLGDQVAGRDPQACRPVVQEMARCQVPFWQDARLEGPHWIATLDIGLRVTHESYRESRPAFEAHFASQLSDEDRATLGWLDANAVALARALHADAPLTLMHGDFRLDNLFFDERPEPWVVDWQGVGRAPGVHDLAYFLCGSLPVEVSRDDELALVRDYHAALESAGVAGYDFERCLRDYRRCVLLGLHRMVTVEMVNLGEERGADLLESWVGRVLARVRGIDGDALL